MAVLAQPAILFAFLELSALDAVAGTVMRELLAGFPVADELARSRILDGFAREFSHLGRFLLSELGISNLAADLLRSVLLETLQQAWAWRRESFAHHFLAELTRRRGIGVSRAGGEY